MTRWVLARKCAVQLSLSWGVVACTAPADPPFESRPLPFSNQPVETRARAPERRFIDPQTLPEPFATVSATRNIQVRRPGGIPVLYAPPGFSVQAWASGLSGPRRALALANGDVIVAESFGLKVSILRDTDGDGRPDRRADLLEGTSRPYGLAHSDGWLYVGFENAVVRARFEPGDLGISSEPEVIASLPGGGHWTRDLAFSDNGATLFVGIGSQSNYNGQGREPPNRALILAMNPDGSNSRVYASGLRNPSSLAIQPDTGDLWAAVTERDGLGDDLPPDFATAVRSGGFYGWPWAYLGPNPEPRLSELDPEAIARSLVPDVLLPPHGTPLGAAFYQGDMFPSGYDGDLLVALHGSYNRSKRSGYSVLRIPMNESGRPEGGFETFIDGFGGGPGPVWGRPTGLTLLADGSLLVLDDGSQHIWRVTYHPPAPVGSEP